MQSLPEYYQINCSDKGASLYSQVRLVSELGKIEGGLQELNKMKVKKDVGQYSIEIIELF